jgi:peptidoglycan/xylan/chitin deacetylase (PgdA/CDA1 family)
MTISITFDIEPDLHTGEYLGISVGIPRIIKILGEYKIKGTFFTTCDCIEKHPEIFRKLKKEGHEIALHGYRHERFDDLSIKDKEESIKKSILFFKRVLKEKPRGFRAPQHSIDYETLKLLEKYNFRYDSSKTPLNLLQFLFFPKRLKVNTWGFFAKHRKMKYNTLTEIPTTSFLVPFVSLIVRVFPRYSQRFFIKFLSKIFDNIVFYAHSWDFIELKNSKLDKMYSHKRFMRNFDYILGFMKSKNYKFVKMEELI